MRRNIPSLRFFIRCVVLLLSLIVFALPGFAQTSVGVPPLRPVINSPSFGLELGYGLHTQQGSYTCDCGSVFSGGSGNGVTGSAFGEMPIDREFSAGLKAGLDYKNTTSNTVVNEVVIVQPSSSSQNYALTMPVQRSGILKISLLKFTPYIQYQLFGTDLFVQLGPGISYVINSSFTQTRNMLSDSVTLPDGTTANNLTFTNGMRTETIQDGSLSNIPSLLFSAIISAGYGFSLGAFVVSPTVTYDFPLSNYQSNSNLQVSSIYGSLGVKLKL